MKKDLTGRITGAGAQQVKAPVTTAAQKGNPKTKKGTDLRSKP